MAFALSSMQVTSAAFANHQAIPCKHTGEGEDVSPALAWQGVPEGLTQAELLKEIEPHLLGMNRLVGTYQRG